MPWGWECRSKHIKQNPPKRTDRQQPIGGEFALPGPNYYEPPKIYCGDGYSKIKRAPAYTFGHLTPVSFSKPFRAQMPNVQGLSSKGSHKVTHGVVTPHIEPPPSTMDVPGPGAYAPRTEVRVKRPPAYSMAPAAKPPYESFDMWTPSPNMYWPSIPSKKPPSYTFGYRTKEGTLQKTPDPGAHEPNFGFVRESKPAYSLGSPFRRRLHPSASPAPNTYCDKKFMFPKRTLPAPSFGIIHSPYLGTQAEYLKSTKLDLLSEE